MSTTEYKTLDRGQLILSSYMSELAPTTRESSRSVLDKLAGLLHPGSDALTCDWSRVTFEDANYLREQLKLHLTPPSVNTYMAVLRGVLRVAWKLGLMSTEQYQLARSFKMLATPGDLSGRHLTTEELRKFFMCLTADTSPMGRRDHALFAVARTTGARRMSLRLMELGHLNLPRLTVYVQGKSAANGDVPMAEWVRAPLTAWLETRGPGEGALFCRMDKWGNPAKKKMALSHGGIHGILLRRIASSGVDPFTFHDLRRTLAGDMFDANVDTAAVQRQLLHARSDTTTRYDRRPLERMRDLVQVIGDPLA